MTSSLREDHGGFAAMTCGRSPHHKKCGKNNRLLPREHLILWNDGLLLKDLLLHILIILFLQYLKITSSQKKNLQN
jgi:hypothetical protein